MIPTLLKTKLHIPTLRSSLVPRPHLIEKLNGGLSGKLTLVSAPAGYGKTTAIAAWLNQLKDCRFCWLSLGEDDNDPGQFWAYVIAAMQTVYPHLATDIAPLLQGAAVTDFSPLLIRLLNEIAESSDRLVLALDDYHLIQNKTVHETMDFWLAHIPTHLHIVILSRADPPLSLPQLRTRGQMTEVRDSDLRFTEAEAAVFLNDVMGLKLTPEDVAALEARTEGWIASLQLASLAMQSPTIQPQERHDFVATFTGSDRYIVDYLVEEVFRQQPLPIQNFLYQTAILSQLCGPLCDAILETELLKSEDDVPAASPTTLPSQQILEYLDTTNLFLIPLDNQRNWYRYHHLFRDLLRYRLQETYPERIVHYHHRASEWFEKNGFVEEAIAHALAAEASKRAARLIEQSAHPLFGSGKMPQIQQWMAQLPSTLITTRPRLYMIAGWLFFRTGQFSKLETHLQNPPAIETVDGKPGDSESGDNVLHGEYLILRANDAFIHGRFDDCKQLANQALQLLPPENMALRMPATTVLAWSYEAAGDVATAIRYHQEVAAMGYQADLLTGMVASLGMLVQHYAQQGDQQQAMATFAQVDQLADERGVQWIPLLGPAYIGMGHVYFQQGHVDDAIQYLKEGIARCRQWGGLAIAAMRGYAILAEAFRQEKRFEEEQSLLAEIQHFVQLHNVPAWATGLPTLPAPNASKLLDPLTSRERDVLRLLVAGYLSPQIADELIIGVSTVRTHIKRIYSKLDAHSRSEAIERAHTLDLV